MTGFNGIKLKLYTLVIFRNLLSNNVVKSLIEMLDSLESELDVRIKAYSSFSFELLKEGGNLTEYIRDLLFIDDNFYIKNYAKRVKMNEDLEDVLSNELAVLEQAARITSGEVRSAIGYEGYLPDWETSDVDFKREYLHRLANIDKLGYGIYSKYHAFAVEEGSIIPVKFPDNIRFTDLKGYEKERKKVVDNTLALMKGETASNVLLYGDAGTGKSSTVKAILNEYKEDGLRVIEIAKDQLSEIPNIVEQIHGISLKFILFVDDLSFSKNNEDLGSLKSVLEGSLSNRPPNIVVYATSNRRHLVKETFSDRKGDDIHVNETIQEIASLSERFGLSVSFLKPDKTRYLEIVHALKEEYGVEIDSEELNMLAEQYAILRGGRSPRIARHLMEQLVRREDDYL